MNTGGYEWSICSVAMEAIIQLFLFVAFFTWEVYLWVHVKHFGSQSYLNDKVKYVLVFVDIPATEPWLRKSLIVTLVIIFVVNSFKISCTSSSREGGVENWRHGSLSLTIFSISTPYWSFDLLSSLRIPCAIRFVPQDQLTDD
jgi:hypothetical protein